jgi:hypothetical protein
MTLSFNYIIYSFDVEDFKSGMTKSTVHSILLNKKFDKIETEEDRIVAYDLPQTEVSRLYSFNFYKGKLVRLQKNLKPSLKFFIKMSEQFNRDFGKPFDVIASNCIDVPGEIYSLILIWKNKGESIELNYNIYPDNHQLFVVYKEPNNHFK